MKISIRYCNICNVIQIFKLRNVFALWHVLIFNVDFSKLPTWNGKYSPNDFEIIYINLNILFESMMPNHANLYKEKILFHKDLSSNNIKSVIDHWKRHEKLIPPVILVMDKTIDPNSLNTNLLNIADGRHRINVAYFLRNENIPIMILKKQSVKVKSILSFDNG